MEIYFAYARLLKREREKLRHKVQRPSPEAGALRRPCAEPLFDVAEYLTFSSVCQSADH